MRTAGVAYTLLTRYHVALNGVILVSPYLDFASGNAGLGMNEPYVNFLPTYAATAWYHNALPNRPAELQPFLREVEAFAQDVYAPVLFKGARATAEERQTVLAGLARYTGVSEEYWDRANLRMDEGRFLQELMRAKGVVIGRVDTRYSGGSLSRIAESTAYDPYERRRPGDRRDLQRLLPTRAESRVRTESTCSPATSGRTGTTATRSRTCPWVVPYANTIVDLVVHDDDEPEDEGAGAAGLLRPRLPVSHGRIRDRASRRRARAAQQRARSSTTTPAT